jgi:hypothetical protein
MLMAILQFLNSNIVAVAICHDPTRLLSHSDDAMKGNTNINE